MRRFSAVAALVLVAGLTAGAHADDIWKWTDAQGVVHYSDRPVPGAVLIKGNEHPDDTSGQPDDQKPLQASSQQITDQLNQEAAQRKVDQDKADARADQCKKAKDNYTKLIQARRIYNTDSNGQREYLSDQQADQERVQARIDMDSACGTDTD
jgi:hypothetical protein